MHNLFDGLEEYGDTIALISSNISISYLELVRRADQIGEKLANGSLIACDFRNDLGSLICYVACIRRGVIPLILTQDRSLHSDENILQLFRPRYLLLRKSEKYLRHSKHVIDCEDYSIIESSDYSTCENVNALALMMPTSGSTGSPKYVRLSHRNLVTNIGAIQSSLSLTEFDRAITTLPFNYTFGLSVINTHLCAGGSIVLNEHSIIRREFWELVKNYSVTSISGVPYSFEMLRRMKYSGVNYPSIRYVAQAGGRLNESTADYFRDISEISGTSFFRMYGQTEASPRMSCIDVLLEDNYYGSVGRAIDGGRFTIQQEYEGEGEIHYFGDNVCLGYAKNYIEVTDDDIFKGRLETGDIGYLDQEYLYISGRISRILKVFGNRISMDHVEEILTNCEIECACVGFDDNPIILTTSSKHEVKAKEILKKRFPKLIRSFQFRIINNIPKNKNGKIDYASIDQ